MSKAPGDPEGKSAPRPALLRLALVFYGLLLAAALGWGALAGRSLFYTGPAAAARGVEPWNDVGLGLLAGGVVVLLSRQLTRHTLWGQRLAFVLGSLLGQLSVAECVLLAALSGVAEEAFFRGALQPQVGLVAASLLFGLAHFAPRRELLPWTAFSVAAGFLLGTLFDATGNLVAPVLAHALINAVNLRFLAVRYAPEA